MSTIEIRREKNLDNKWWCRVLAHDGKVVASFQANNIYAALSESSIYAAMHGIRPFEVNIDWNVYGGHDAL